MLGIDQMDSTINGPSHLAQMYQAGSRRVNAKNHPYWYEQ